MKNIYFSLHTRAFVLVITTACCAENEFSKEDYEKLKRENERLKEEIKENEGLTASIGLGPNKLVAKLASDMQKPDGLTVIREEEAQAKLDPLPIRALPGVGGRSRPQHGLSLLRQL